MNYILMILKNAITQPNIKHKPPIGVTGPKILAKLCIPNKSLQANKYKDPQNKMMPERKKSPARANFKFG